jgi:hypothetical protein
MRTFLKKTCPMSVTKAKRSPRLICCRLRG